MLIRLPPEGALRTKYASAYKASGCAWQLGDIQNMLVIISVLCGSQITAQPFYFRGWSRFDVYVKALTLHALLSTWVLKTLSQAWMQWQLPHLPTMWSWAICLPLWASVFWSITWSDDESDESDYNNDNTFLPSSWYKNETMHPKSLAIKGAQRILFIYHCADNPLLTQCRQFGRDISMHLFFDVS